MKPPTLITQGALPRGVRSVNGDTFQTVVDVSGAECGGDQPLDYRRVDGCAGIVRLRDTHSQAFSCSPYTPNSPERN